MGAAVVHELPPEADGELRVLVHGAAHQQFRTAAPGGHCQRSRNDCHSSSQVHASVLMPVNSSSIIYNSAWSNLIQCIWVMVVTCQYGLVYTKSVLHVC